MRYEKLTNYMQFTFKNAAFVEFLRVLFSCIFLVFFRIFKLEFFKSLFALLLRMPKMKIFLGFVLANLLKIREIRESFSRKGFSH